MLKGHVFSKQIFKSEAFACFIDTFLDKKCGVANYKNKMNVTYSGSNLTIARGLACIRGRFIEEDSQHTLSAGTDTAFCKLVIEIDLDKENTESEFNQGSYKIVKGTSSYPTLTQDDIVANNSGKYQYELARFKTTVNGITDFKDMRTYFYLDTIYNQITTEYREILDELKQELENVKDGSAYILNEVEKKTIAGSEGSPNLGSYSYSAVFKRIGKIVNVTVTVISNAENVLIKLSVPDFAIPESTSPLTAIANTVLKGVSNMNGEGVASIYTTADGSTILGIYTNQLRADFKMEFVANLTYILE